MFADVSEVLTTAIKAMKDEGIKHFRNVGKLLPDETAQHMSMQKKNSNPYKTRKYMSRHSQTRVFNPKMTKLKFVM
jgi:hypothetical protein